MRKQGQTGSISPSAHTDSVLKQRCKCRPVVVLADREKEEMDEELRHSLKGYQIEWHTRSGAPHCSSDLERVAAGQAKNIILLDNNVEVSLSGDISRREDGEQSAPLHECILAGPAAGPACCQLPCVNLLHGLMTGQPFPVGSAPWVPLLSSLNATVIYCLTAYTWISGYLQLLVKYKKHCRRAGCSTQQWRLPPWLYSLYLCIECALTHACCHAER